MQQGRDSRQDSEVDPMAEESIEEGKAKQQASEDQLVEVEDSDKNKTKGLDEQIHPETANAGENSSTKRASIELVPVEAIVQTLTVIFNDLDKNGNGNVEKKEFLRACTSSPLIKEQ